MQMMAGIKVLVSQPIRGHSSFRSIGRRFFGSMSAALSWIQTHLLIANITVV
jgi:hypothetical protein